MNDEHRSQTDLSFYNTCEGSLTSDRDLFMNTQTYTRKHTRIRSYTLPLLTAHLPTHIHTPTHPFDYKYTLTYIKFPLKINFVNISLSLILSSYILLWHFSVLCLVSVFTHIFPVYFCFLHACLWRKGSFWLKKRTVSGQYQLIMDLFQILHITYGQNTKQTKNTRGWKI